MKAFDVLSNPKKITMNADIMAYLTVLEISHPWLVVDRSR